MTVILEEELEDSNMNFTQNLAASSTSKNFSKRLSQARNGFNKSLIMKEGQENSFSREIRRGEASTIDNL